MDLFYIKKLIFSLFIIAFLCGCSSNDNEISIDLMLNKKRNYFDEIYNKGIYNDFWNNIMRTDSAVNELLIKKELDEDDIDDFKIRLGNIYSYNEIDFNLLKKTIGNRSLLEKDIKLIQYSLYSYYESLIFINKYSFNMIRPIVCGDNNRIKLGEIYKCEVFLAAANESHKPLVIIEKDTLKYNEKDIPYYEIMPSKKGKYCLKGKMQSLEGESDNSFYDFSVDFVVE